MPDVSINLWMGLLLHAKPRNPPMTSWWRRRPRRPRIPKWQKSWPMPALPWRSKGPRILPRLINSQWDIFGSALKEANIKVE